MERSERVQVCHMASTVCCRLAQDLDSSLLRALISPECFSVLGEKDYNRRLSKLGDLCFVQLAELRHRGAFSTVAQTFALLSRQCAVSKDSGCRSLTLKWYNVSAKSSAIVETATETDPLRPSKHCTLYNKKAKLSRGARLVCPKLSWV